MCREGEARLDQSSMASSLRREAREPRGNEGFLSRSALGLQGNQDDLKRAYSKIFGQDALRRFFAGITQAHRWSKRAQHLY